MQSYCFTVIGEAKGKGRPRFTKGGGPFTPKETVSYENLVKLEARRGLGLFKPLAGAVRLSLTVYCSIPQSWSQKKKQRALEGKIYPDKKPDIDNIVKIIADALNGVAWVDDKQIVDVRCLKLYGETPHTIVQFSHMENV